MWVPLGLDSEIYISLESHNDTNGDDEFREWSPPRLFTFNIRSSR